MEVNMLSKKKLPKIILASFCVLLLATSCAENKEEENAELSDLASPEEIAQEIEEAPLGIHEDNLHPESDNSKSPPLAESAPDVQPEKVEKPELHADQDDTKEEEPTEIAPEPETKKPTLVIVVSKKKQRLWIYENGSSTATYSWLVSTGSERTRCPPKGKCYIANTPNGEFTPTRAYRYYTSKKWKSKMDFAVFFNGGIALHATYGADHLSMLGRKDSGGCVRQSEANASKTFAVVKKHGLENTRVIIQD